MREARTAQRAGPRHGSDANSVAGSVAPRRGNMFKDAKRRMKQQALQALGAAEATEDHFFKEEYSQYKNNCRAIKSIRKSMATHLEAIRNMQVTASALSVELAAFHQRTAAAKATVAFGQAHAETERIQLSSVERLYGEEVNAVTELLLWQTPEIEDKVRNRKKLLLDYDAHLRKYENLTRAEINEANDPGKKKKGALFSRRKTEEEIAEEITHRRLKLEESEEAVDQSTRWLLEQFDDMSMKLHEGTLLQGPMSALLACQLHLMQSCVRRLEHIKPLFESVDLYSSTLTRYDKEPANMHELDVEGVAHMTNMVSTRFTRGPQTEQGLVFGMPLQTSLPTIVIECVMRIRQDGLLTEGLFRIPGNQEAVDRMKARYDQGHNDVATGEPDTHVNDVCTLLKLWLRELPEPLIPSAFYEPLMEILRDDINTEHPATVANVVRLAEAMPKEHRELLGFLSTFLKELTQFSNHNKMNSGNLATCFAPSVMRAPEDIPPNVVLHDMQCAITAMRLFIDFADKLPQPKNALALTAVPRRNQVSAPAPGLAAPPGL